MFPILRRLTPGYIRLLQTQAYHNVCLTPPAEKSVPGMAMILGAVGIGMCGYSSRQLALYHRPSARVLQWAGTYTDASVSGAAAQRFMDPRNTGPNQELPTHYFVGQKFP